MRAAPLVLAAAALNIAMSCGVLSGPATRTRPFAASPAEVLACARKVLYEMQFDEEKCDVEDGYLRTKWRVEPGVRYREMYRERATVEVSSEDAGTVASIRIEKEINENAADPASVSRAMWIPGGGDDLFQQRIAVRIGNILSPYRLEE